MEKRNQKGHGKITVSHMGLICYNLTQEFIEDVLSG